jgi:hypothetical protein
VATSSATPGLACHPGIRSRQKLIGCIRRQFG